MIREKWLQDGFDDDPNDGQSGENESDPLKFDLTIVGPLSTQ